MLNKKFWFHNDIIKSTAFDSISIAIPEAERFILRVIGNKDSNILDARLKDGTKILLDEELSHSKVHDTYNLMLEKENYNLKPIQKVNFIFLNFFEKYFSDLQKICFSVCIEHFTAIMARPILEHKLLEKGIDKNMKKLWHWHALEELDHRHGTFDVYLYFRGSYIRRFFTMLFITPIFLVLHFFGHLSLLKQNKELFKFKTFFKLISFYFGKSGLYSLIILDYLRFYKPSYHPLELKIKNNILKEVKQYELEEEFKNMLKNRI